MYVSEGMNSFKVIWKDSGGTENTLFVEAFDDEGARAEAEDYIPKMYHGRFEIARIELRKIGKGSFYMKKLICINNWTIKEKLISEVPASIDDDRKYAVYAPDGRCMEDNLLLSEAEEFCRENKDLCT